MAKDKKPDKNNGSKKGTVTCERTYVLDRCLRTVNQESRRMSPNSPAAIRVLDLPCRHQRRGAVRDKRTVSLDHPRPAHQRSDNAYVETSFVDGTVPLQSQGAPAASSSSASCSSAQHAASGSREPTAADGGRPANQPVTADMDSSAEPPPRPGDGIIDEFPAYVPWKAELQAENSACNVCHKCRCPTCQKLCKYPGMRVCGLLDVRSRCDEACVETTTVCVPCIQKTARCPAANAARAEAVARAEAAARTGAAGAGAAADGTAATDAPDGVGEPRARRTGSGKCRLRWLLCCLCCPCPCCEVDDVTECVVGCRGNVNVSGCECVDWEALRRNNRRRVNAAAAAVAASRDRRRCRDNHYYITALPHLANPATAATAAAEKTAADGENVGTAEKKSKLRKFLRF